MALKDESLLIPLNHWEQKSNVCIVLDSKGNFCGASQDRKAVRIRIPVTESSQHSRTGAVKINDAHALHEKLEYLSSLNDEKRLKYLSVLSAWCNYSPKLQSVFNYVSSGTIIEDLSRSGIKPDKDLFIRFSVIILNDETNLWEDPEIVVAWQRYCQIVSLHEEGLCQVTGEIAYLADKHAKGINWNASGAKLLSRNSENYVFKGRFIKEEEANSISVIASHKASAMLNYLIENYSYKCDKQAIIAWTIDDGTAQIDPFADSFSHGLYSMGVKTDSDKLIEASGELGVNFSKQPREALLGIGNAEKLKERRRVAVMAVDAATTGRMGITFYQDMRENEYLDRIIAWHASCNWWLYYGGKHYVSAPGVDRIIAAVYGEQKSENHEKIKKQARERLLHHIICGQPLDYSWIAAAVARASQPYSFSKLDGRWDKNKWLAAINVSCAMIKKYYVKEGFKLKLDKNCTDRSYLFGRLLAIADRFESYDRFLQEKKTEVAETDKRPTNAVRYMPMFASRPMRTWQIIIDHLHPCRLRLDSADWYQWQIDEIMCLFHPEDLNDKALDGKYLLGYSLQRMALKSENNEKIKEEINHEHDK